VIKPLFDVYGATLEARGVITKTGTIVDGISVDVPRQRNTRQDNETIKQGEEPKDWSEKPHKLSQKDLDARWTKNNEVTYYGYKNHVRADMDSLLITDYALTDASVHDLQVLPELIDEENRSENLFGDSAFKIAAIDERLAELGIHNFIHEKGVRNRPLSELQKGINRLKSGTRSFPPGGAPPLNPPCKSRIMHTDQFRKRLSAQLTPIKFRKERQSSFLTHSHSANPVCL
jgi:IS5 family transposase